MHRITAPLLLTVLFLALLGAPGCVKLKQVVTVMPDGAGKVQMRFGLSPQSVALARENDDDPFQEVLPEAMKKKTRGVAAFTEPVREKVDGFSYLTYTVYFKDINKLRVSGLGEGKPAEYRYLRKDEGATLTVTHGVTLSMIGNYTPTPEAEREQAEEAMKGMSFSEHFVMPGEVKPIEGLSVQGNTAKLDLVLDDLLTGTGPIETLKNKSSLTFIVPKIDVSDDAIAAFNKEMQAAIKAWEKQQGAAE